MISLPKSAVKKRLKSRTTRLGFAVPRMSWVFFGNSAEIKLYQSDAEKILFACDSG